jgi:hypothetical protein
VKVRHVIITAVAAALGVWVAVAAAQGGLGAGSTSGGTTCVAPGGTTPVCPKPEGFGNGGGSGGGGRARHMHHAHGVSGEPEPTHPEPARRAHGRAPTFTFSVRLGRGLGAGGSAVHGYATHVLPPRDAPASCTPRLTRRPNIAQRDQVARIHLRPPVAGWCDGRYHVTVTLSP